MDLQVGTDGSTDIVDVTAAVEDVRPGHVSAGTCTVFVRHTTAAVIVTEAEPRLLADIEDALHRLVPESVGYRHDEIDDNAAAHVRASVLGESVTVPIEDGELDLGTWQSILLVECDGPRTRTLRVVETGE